MSKKVISIFFICLMFLFAMPLIANAETNVVVKSIKLSSSKLELIVGDTVTLNVAIKPADAINQEISWKSSKPEIVSVNSEGNVCAKKTGSATITVTTTNGKKATCKVTVKDLKIKMKSSKRTMKVGETIILDLTFSPKSSSRDKVEWACSDDTIATVNKNGFVKALTKGKVVITAMLPNGNSAQCIVTIKEVDIKSIKLSETSIELKEGETDYLYAIINPQNASNKTLTWSSSDNNVATVDKNGIVTAINSGKTKITAKSVSGKKATCNVNVTDTLSAIHYDFETQRLDVSSNYQKYTFVFYQSPENSCAYTVSQRFLNRTTNGVIASIGYFNAEKVLVYENGKLVKTVDTPCIFADVKYNEKKQKLDLGANWQKYELVFYDANGSNADSPRNATKRFLSKSEYSQFYTKMFLKANRFSNMVYYNVKHIELTQLPEKLDYFNFYYNAQNGRYYRYGDNIIDLSGAKIKVEFNDRPAEIYDYDTSSNLINNILPYQRIKSIDEGVELGNSFEDYYLKYDINSLYIGILECDSDKYQTLDDAQYIIVDGEKCKVNSDIDVSNINSGDVFAYKLDENENICYISKDLKNINGYTTTIFEKEDIERDSSKIDEIKKARLILKAYKEIDDNSDMIYNLKETDDVKDISRAILVNSNSMKYSEHFSFAIIFE